MTHRGLGVASMGKASRTKVESTRREKIAAQRAAERRAEKRKRILLASGSVVVVLAVVLVFVIVKLNNKPTVVGAQGLSNGPTGSALAAVVDKVTSVPASTLDTVGNGGGAVTGKPTTISGSALTSSGKPEMFYMGAEYCPYCAAERWAMIVALSRFGTFTGLSTIHSSTTDSPAGIPTWTFFGSRYTSKYLTFTSVEETQNYRKGNSAALNVGYVPLQTPTAAQQALLERYDTSGYIPFIDVANKYVEVGNLLPYGPQVLQGLSWSQIAQAMQDPSSTVAQCVDASANYLTAAILKVTGNQPASACTPAVKALETQLG